MTAIVLNSRRWKCAVCSPHGSGLLSCPLCRGGKAGIRDVDLPRARQLVSGRAGTSPNVLENRVFSIASGRLPELLQAGQWAREEQQQSCGLRCSSPTTRQHCLLIWTYVYGHIWKIVLVIEMCTFWREMTLGKEKKEENYSKPADDCK